ncbi:unnamed protein product [Lathyrus sativus]|nr:unnamed protein product [Lathyrus sativus]
MYIAPHCLVKDEGFANYGWNVTTPCSGNNSKLIKYSKILLQRDHKNKIIHNKKQLHNYTQLFHRHRWDHRLLEPTIASASKSSANESTNSNERSADELREIHGMSTGNPEACPADPQLSSQTLGSVGSITNSSMDMQGVNKSNSTNNNNNGQ